MLKARVAKGAPGPVEAFKREGADFVVETDLRALVDAMNALTEQPLLSFEQVEQEVLARDREIGNPDLRTRRSWPSTRRDEYLADKITRVAAPHRLLDPKAGPLIAVRLNLLTRKTLGGLQTDLESRVLGAEGNAHRRPLRGRRGGRLRRRRHARLPRARGNVPRRLHLLGPRGRPVGGGGVDPTRTG